MSTTVADSTSPGLDSDGAAGSPRTTIALDDIDPATVDADDVLIAALAGQLLADSTFRIAGGEAECVATGTVELVGGRRLAQIGVTAADPNGPDDDPYALLTDDELGDVVAVWARCTDVGALVTEALLSTAPEDVDEGVEQCIQTSLATGIGARFLFAALRDVEGVDPAITDVLRVLDGCTAGAAREDVRVFAPGLWPWLSVDVPGYRLDPIDPDSEDASDLQAFLGGVAASPSIEAAAVRATSTDTDLVAAALIVASVSPRGDTAERIEVGDYVAGLVSSAGDAEVFEFPLPSGVDVIGWESVEEELIFLVWAGERVVVFATGGLEAVQVLSLYSELVPGV